MPNVGSLIADAQFGEMGQAVVTTADATLLTTDAGVGWNSLTVPGTRIGGHSVDVHGATIAAASLDADGSLTYQRSSDAGKSWTSQHLPLPTSDPPAQVGVSIAEDGTTVAVAAEMPHSSGVRGVGALFVGSAGRELVARSMPIAGTTSWVGKHLVVVGGPLNAELFVSDDLGATWTQSTVEGVKVADDAPVPGGAPSVGLPVSTADRSVIPVTLTKGSDSVIDLLATTDGRTFTSLGTVPTGGGVGQGSTAIGTTAGPTTIIVADPSSTVLIVVNGSQVTTITPTGLPGPVDYITFSDATHGLASATVTACASDKTDCTTTTGLYTSSDGGQTWTPSQPSVA